MNCMCAEIIRFMIHLESRKDLKLLSKSSLKKEKKIKITPNLKLFFKEKQIRKRRKREFYKKMASPLETTYLKSNLIKMQMEN